MAYADEVSIPLDEIDEQTLAICKEYNISYEYALDNMAYTDIGVIYAKMVNAKAFNNYNDFLNMGEEQQSKYTMDFGEVRPYIYELVLPETQQESIKEFNETQTKLRDMYRSGGKLIND